VYATFGLSILLSYPSGDGDFFHDTYALWVALVAYNYHRR